MAGCWRDNVFVEGLWRSIKYEDVYINAYDSVSGKKAGLDNYIEFYVTRRPHQSFGGKALDMIYFAGLPIKGLAHAPCVTRRVVSLRSKGALGRCHRG